eukprot:tig00001155_g7312.t1
MRESKKDKQLEDMLAFYGAYHSNDVNKIMHAIGIPGLLFSLMVVLAPLKPPGVDDLTAPLFALNGGLAVAILYSILFIYLETVAGCCAAAVLLAIWVGANYFALAVKDAWMWAIGIHVLCWVLQFVGHGVFEKRRPALLDSLVQAFATAPFFICLEGLFLLGYRPQLRRKVFTRSAAKIKGFQEKKRAA